MIPARDASTAAAAKPAFPFGGKAVVLRNMWCSAMSVSRKVSTESSAAKYAAPRVQLCDFFEELCEKKGRARGDDAAAGKQGHASLKRAAWGVTLHKAMAGLPEPGESRVRYLLDMFERLLFLSRCGNPEHRVEAAQGQGVRETSISSEDATQEHWVVIE